ncbi:MAG: hypothetical protein WBI82_00360 [Sphaerochaeta sp.]
MPPFPPQGAIYLTLLSPPSLGNGTMGMLPLLSLRWGINGKIIKHQMGLDTQTAPAGETES